MAVQFHRATKSECRLRMGISGPSGSGKTYTALMIASRLAELAGQPGSVAVIDSERESASKYADLFLFDVINLGSDPKDPAPFHPQRYEEAIAAASSARYVALVIDSLSHAWSGRGGVLDQVDKASAKMKGNSFRAWGGADGGTNLQNHLIDTILAAPCHVICTMRSKTEYIIETGLDGKSSPRKVGMAPVQRDGMEYELDIVGDMDERNTMVVRKSRAVVLNGQVIAQPGAALADTIAEWLSSGTADRPTAAQVTAVIEKGRALGVTDDLFLDTIERYYQTRSIAALTLAQVQDLDAKLSAALTRRTNGNGTVPQGAAPTNGNGR